ncbi:MAG: adenine phosphoribosyltransferase [Planctomycetota bacterium]|jgi:adenine phosphoribosyltransferase|nr:adenine phosphoribosyltransferase [Planctomycetota bacterium]
MNLSDYLRDVPDFPKPGIIFKDITPLLADPKAFQECVDQLQAMDWGAPIDRIAGIESRGFLFGVPLAQALGIGFTPIRKPGKLPWRTQKVEYELEYGTDAVEIHEDGVGPGQRVLVVDDLLATGGTMAASCELVEAVGGVVAGCAVVVELGFLSGRDRLAPHTVGSLVTV